MKNLKKIAKHFKKLSLCEGCGCGGSTSPTPNPPMSQHMSQQLRPNQLNDPNFIAQIVAQVMQQMQNQGGIQEQGLNRMDRDMTPEEEFLKDNPSPGTSSPMSSNNTTKIKLKMSNIEDEVTITEKPGNNLTDVTISWGNESHTVDFEAGDVIDDHGNEGMDIETSADSDDGRWQFILDVQAEATFPMTGDFADWDWEELIIQDHPENEDHLDPEDRSDQDPQ